MIRVGVSDDHGVEPADVLAQHLDAKFRRRIHHELHRIRGDVDGGTGAMVLRVGEECLRVIPSDDGHSLRSAGAEERE